MSDRRLEEPQLKELRELLDVCDDLRKIFGSMMDKNSFTIPQVVVVGNQSVGKSSLLELLSGFQLPAGTGIVTRCPIVLQIRRGPRERYEVEGEEIPLQRFESALNYAQARLVDNSCNRSGGGGMGTGEIGVDVTPHCVTTRIEGPHNRDLTLVDLPGIQYSNSGLTVKIKDIIREYIKNPAAIILLVSTCSSDPTATEALQCAREVDENQSRTICILTKPDELRDDDVPKMTSLIELVEGRHESLKFPQGVFITKARGGCDEKKSIEEIRQMETNFFSKHPHFQRCMASMRKAGHENLLNKVEELALKTMKTSLPKMQSEVSKELANKEVELEDIDQSQFVDDDQKKQLIISGLITKVIEALKENYEKQNAKRLNECLEKFEIDVISITKETAESLEDVGDSLGERDPLRPSGVVNQNTIDSNCTAFIQKIKEPAGELFDSIFSIVSDSVFEVITKEVHRETVRDAMCRVSETFLRQFKKEVALKLKESFEFEDVYYFSQLTKFYGPTVQMMQSLDDNFTFSGFLENLSQGELSSSSSAGPYTQNTTQTLMHSDMSTSNSSLNPVEELDRKKISKKITASKRKNLGISNNSSSYNNDLPNGVLHDHSAPEPDHKPRITKRILKRFLDSSKSSPIPNARFIAEADFLHKEHDTLHSTLQNHHYLTGFRVSGNVGKLLLYHFRKKMPSDLRTKLESSLYELSESLNPDQELFQQMKMIQSDIKQLQEARDKIKAVMKSTRN